MSDADEAVNRREVAYRLFAAEFEDSDLSYSESDDDRSPNYVVTPSGARVNRLFAVGVLTEVEPVSDDVLRGRIVDPTGAFVAYAGQYQPDEQAFLERIETPTFVAMTGKARTFQPDDSDQVFTSVRPESINEVSAATRDRWAVQTAEQTLDRIGHAARALRHDLSGDALQEALLEEGVDEALATGIPLAFDHYGTTPTYLDALRDLALDAARVVAGERDQVGDLTADPDESGPTTAHDIPTGDIDSLSAGDEQETSSDTATTSGSDDRTPTEDGPDSSVAATETGSTDTTAATSSESTTDTATADTGATASEETTVDTESAGSESEETASNDSKTTAQPGDTPGDAGDDLGDFDPEEFELEEETREQVKEEHGVEFQTGAEVEEPDDEDADAGADQADTPEGDEETTEDADADQADTPEGDEETAEAVSEETTQPDSDESVAAADETASQSDTADDSAPADDAGGDEAGGAEPPDDLQAAVVELMGDVDDGDGAPRADLVAEMEQRYGVGEDDTDDAIQDALMDGECYEPGDGRYKPI
jgi:RPA family protein